MRLVRALLAAFIVLALAAGGAGAVERLHKFAALSTGWWFQGASADFDFQNNRAYAGGSISTAASQLSTSNNGGMIQWRDGHWSSVAANTARISDLGLLVEEARTNDALWARDLTNAVWVKTTMTAALTATGIDNAPNSATTLTATAGNATVLQAITLGSTADTFDVWLKRVSGSGTVNITLNGGVGWSAVALTTTWTQFQITATLANPAVGIQIVTNGDVIAADFGQMEPGGFATSPILTTSAAVTRNTDMVTVIGQGATIIPVSASAFFQTFGMTGVGNPAPRILDLNNSRLAYTSTTVVTASDNVTVASGTVGSGSATGTVKSAYGLDNTSMTVIANGGTMAIQGTSTWTTSVAGQTPRLGNNSSGLRACDCYVQRGAFATAKGVFNGMTAP